MKLNDLIMQIDNEIKAYEDKQNKEYLMEWYMRALSNIHERLDSKIYTEKEVLDAERYLDEYYKDRVKKGDSEINPIGIKKELEEEFRKFDEDSSQIDFQNVCMELTEKMENRYSSGEFNYEQWLYAKDYIADFYEDQKILNNVEIHNKIANKTPVETMTKIMLLIYRYNQTTKEPFDNFMTRIRKSTKNKDEEEILYLLTMQKRYIKEYDLENKKGKEIWQMLQGEGFRKRIITLEKKMQNKENYDEGR